MYKKYFYKSPVFLGLLILLITMAIRVSWMGKGVYAFTDETRYEASQYLVAQLLDGNVKEGVRALLKTDARPVDCLLHAIPALVQQLLPHEQGLNHPDSLVWVQYFHILLFGMLAFVFYRLTSLLFPETDYIPLLALACFVLLINNHVHARHILPYDIALMLLLLALGLLVHVHRTAGFISTRAKYIAGILAALAWLTYPGYYWLPVLMMVYLFMVSGSRRFIDGLWEVIPFLTGAFMVVLCFEAVYWCYGKSLLYSLAGLSLGINQGDYHESLEFMILYMKESNGAVGWLLSYAFLIAGALSLIALLRSRMKVFDPVRVFLGLAFGAWAFHMVLGEVFEFMVFYGRLIHAFVPFMIWAVLAACTRLKSFTAPALSVLVALSLFSFWNFHQMYQSITYPRDVLFAFSHPMDGSTLESPVIQLTKGASGAVPYCNIHSPYAYYNIPQRRVDPSLSFYNTAILYPIEGQEVVSCLKDSSSLLLRAPYYLCFAPYSYEGYSPAARRRLQSGLYTTQVMLKTR
ncbi:MAG: hypothetical protein JWM14_1995 [Chitinophagaceae bacterium]|nr:hypothetical protein [Chitinophagaceae bacterium]